ncbi:MAG: hypothetical protein HC897_00330 [Thermoanaerobaculia bacterium]|nr:hypothetical protein [Thermoanaerobaculia bacterium]
MVGGEVISNLEATSNLIRRGWKLLRGLEPTKLVLFEEPGEEWSKISA